MKHVEAAKVEIKQDLDKQNERLKQRLAQRKQKISDNRSMSLSIGRPNFRGVKTPMGGESSFMSGGRSMGGGLANRMFCALSRVNYAQTTVKEGGNFEFDEEEVQEILAMIEELNFNADLAIKLDNHKKVITLLTANSDETEASKIINK